MAINYPLGYLGHPEMDVSWDFPSRKGYNGEKQRHMNQSTLTMLW